MRKKVLTPNFDSQGPKSNLLTRANNKGPYFFKTVFHKLFSGASLMCAQSRPKKLILFTKFVKKKFLHLT